MQDAREFPCVYRPHLFSTDKAQLNIHEAVQPSFNGNASIFAGNFTRHEQHSIALRPMKRSGDRDGTSTYQTSDETTVVLSTQNGIVRTAWSAPVSDISTSREFLCSRS